jgi:AcrR family transcriptional regulator
LLKKAPTLSNTAQMIPIVRKRLAVSADKSDRRVERTLSALLQAFIGLVIEGNYRAITIGQIADRANVGRSTFYDHFQTKDEILLASMGWMFSILADTTDPDVPPGELDNLVSHFWTNRQLANVILAPPVEGKLRRALASRIEDCLGIKSRSRSDPTSIKIAAVRIAAGQLGLLAAWTKGEVSANTASIGEAIRHLSRN